MAEKPYKIEIDYFGLKVTKQLDKLEDAIGMTLSLGPFVKVVLETCAPTQRTIPRLDCTSNSLESEPLLFKFRS